MARRAFSHPPGFLAKRPVAVIAIAQLLGTSLWFSANSAFDELMRVWSVSATDIGWLTGAVQGGFILGTLSLALTGLADRFRASHLFVGCALAGALFNALFAWGAQGLGDALFWRFMVGLSLAGIYPVGMKLVVSWAPERTGQALAQLVAMLTLGTALPHGLKQLGAEIAWQVVISASSLLALLGAALIFWLGDGPHLPARPKPGARRIRVIEAFKVPRFRAAAWGYFGHMWELYAFWTLVPLLVASSVLPGAYPGLGISGLAFGVIGIGALGCLLGGALSRRFGSAPVALAALALSCLCAVLFALFWRQLPPVALLALLLVWGAAVVADSPQFSALSARACPPAIVGAALAILNAIGFAITVVSITAITALFEHTGLDAAWLLVPGPIVGLLGFVLTLRRHRAR
ncbi:MFS transporter [Vreelandella sp. GE22]